MKDSKTQKGFEITEFEDTYGVECSLQMSSSAEEDKIWLGVNHVNVYRMHLNREQVAELLPYLERFVETGRIHE